MDILSDSISTSMSITSKSGAATAITSKSGATTAITSKSGAETAITTQKYIVIDEIVTLTTIAGGEESILTFPEDEYIDHMEDLQE
jgi:hypothetical protein